MKRRIPRTWGERNNIGRKKKTLGYSSDALEQGNREIRETGKKPLQNETIKATKYGRKENEDLRK